eukprot:TRINITY_DN110325_c0_g1_i1.p1 TRINITY_DN110325_c0_g1~~TRINITY_DN110325_c0_g1_i1.p1  ORF type:complete len:451 (+),score=69.01 TRINITY_DN110325_c0_g1_i1:84-1436(+)
MSKMSQSTSGFEELGRNDWVFSHVYPDGLRPGVLVTERLILREGAGLCRWSRLLDTNDDKGVKAQGECWRRTSVKNVRFASKVGDPSREFSLYGERPFVRKRALFAWLWEKLPVLTAWLCFGLNPLSVTTLLCGSLTLTLWGALPREGDRYVMSAAPDLAALVTASGLALLVGVAALLSSWWLRLGGTKESMEKVEPSPIRPHPKAVSRWFWQRGMNGIFIGLLVPWCCFVCITSPILAVQGRKSEDTCKVGGCETVPGNVDGICGVDTCSCGSFTDLSCTPASELQNYCRTTDAPICAANSFEASGIHNMLLITTGGTLLVMCFMLIIWLINHVAIALSWKKVESLISAIVKPEPVAFHRITLTFESEQQGELVFTLSGEEDIAILAKLLMPDTTRSVSEFVPPYAPPPVLGGNFLWPGELEDRSESWDGGMTLDNPQTNIEPDDLQWD